MTDDLWAKSRYGDRPPVTLLQHTRDVMDAAEALFGPGDRPTRLGECWLRFFKLPKNRWRQFHRTLLAACGLHDWGKANDRMQEVLAGKPNATQAIRHEHFSALLVAQKPVWDWLGAVPDVDREVLLAAVLTHHLKADENANRSFGVGCGLGSVTEFKSCHHSTEFREVAACLEPLFGTPPDLSSIPATWDVSGNYHQYVRKVRGTVLEPFHDEVQPRQHGDDFRRRLLMAVRAALIAADAAGSGLRRTDQRVTEWITGTLTEHEVLTATEVEESVIRGRVEDQRKAGRWIDKGDGKEGWNDFQLACDGLGVRALLLAPCGSGKTLAAWRWIAAQLRNEPAKHVLFLYPTRATATEGFRDYVSWAPEGDAALMHGTSGFDLEDMFRNPAGDDPRRDRKFRISEEDERLFALGYWGRRAFAATVDQFLAFLQYTYKPVCMLPVLADAVVVIDEVHSFDNQMFAALKAFLKEFQVPVLCMTATLPEGRQEELTKECGLRLYNDRPGELKTIADAPRYRLRRATNQAEAETAVREALAAGKRVLWVVNQVKRAQSVVHRFVREKAAGGELFARLDGCTAPVQVICYHSRFKLIHRVERHQATMAALKFRKDAPPALGVTTQVCEMSLDIDVDLLVTEDCPVSALVQRMGRCNRATNPRPLDEPRTRGTAGNVIVYPPDDGDHAPYAERQNNLLRGLLEFLTEFDGKVLSQTDIDAVFQNPKKFPSPKLPGDGVVMFLESGPYAVAGEEEFRDGVEFNRQCLLLGEVGDYLAAQTDRRPGFVLPVPRRHACLRDPDNAAHAQLPGHLQVAPDANYHRLTGFHDEPLPQPEGV